jgi:DNA-binding MltR family transcriptional regulator
MLLTTAEDLAKFIEELRRETDRGLPLVAAALIDDRLAETLRAFFVDGPSAEKLIDAGNAPLGTLSSRAELCFALGLIDAYEHSEIALIRKVRNEFAHAKHGLNFSNDRVRSFCAQLQSDLPTGAGYPLDDPRFRFMNASVAMVLRLYHRPDWVVLERRKSKTWVDKDATKWRSAAEEPLPLNHPVLVIGKAQSEKAKD